MKNKNWVPYLVYALLATAILGPMLRPGYILTLDMIFTPKLDLTFQFFGQWESVSAQLPLALLQQLVNKIVPGWLLQKIILLLIFFLAGLSAHKLFFSNKVGSYFAGVLYTVNPFTYTRLMAGQWTFLLAYAVTPFTIKAFMDMLENGELKNKIKVALLTTLVGSMFLQSLFLLFLVYLIVFIIRLITNRKNRAEILRMSRDVGICAAVFLLLNMYWLIPVLVAGPTRLAQIGQEDLFQFAPSISSMFDLASMYGFWNPSYIYTREYLPFWSFLFCIILFFTIYGFLRRPRDNRTNHLAVALALAGLVCFVLSLGISFQFTRKFFEWLYYNLIVFKGFRDSQKFVAMLCLAYAYLGGLGVEDIIAMLNQGKGKILKAAARIIIALTFLVPLLYSFVIFGAWGQINTTDYPAAWYKVNEYLNEDKQDFNVLFLPWHQYMDYNWIPNRIKRLANPAWAFFQKPTISGDNYEIAGEFSESTNPVSKYVEFLLQHKEVDNLGELLAPINVKYIILVDEADYALYEFLRRQKDISVEMTLNGLTLFRNDHPVSRAYGVDSLVYIAGWEEYLELSKTQDTTEYLYIIGDGKNSGPNTKMQNITLTRKNPVVFQVIPELKKYVVFTVSQMVSSDYWEYNGQSSMKNLGITPAFTSDARGGDIIYTRFYMVYLPAYIISLIALIAALYCFFNKEVKYLKKFSHH